MHKFMKSLRNNIIKKSKKVVIKIGSQVLTNKDLTLNRKQIGKIVSQIAKLLKEKKIKPVLVSSGAVAAGMGKLNIKKRPITLPDIQAIASVGQPILIEAYRNEFNKHNLEIGQILVTKEDFQNRTRYLNIINTLSALSRRDIIPVLNENDTVITDEITFGDNDQLSTLVSHAVRSDLTILLSSMDGFLDIHHSNVLIPYVENINKELLSKISSAKTEAGVGGMYSKIKAVKKLTSSGEPVILADGNKKNILLDILNGKEVGTLFVPKSSKLKTKKRWIAYSAKTTGEVHIDEGAKNALLKNSSLLAIGIKKVSGNFNVGSAISVIYQKCVIAKGLTNYTKNDLEQIKGLKSIEFNIT